jgi:hypothetical protein
MQVELLLEDAVSKILRPFLKGSHQTKRISQGFFRALARELASEKFPIAHIRDKSEIQSAAHDSTKLFLIGGTDEAFGEEDVKLLEGRLAFAQNLSARMSNSVRPLPIGVEDPSYARNGMPWNFRKVTSREVKSDTVLVGPFRPTSLSRVELIEAASQYDNCLVLKSRIPAARYSRLSAEHRFVACPEGNGVDTHRFWETLYRGSIPVVKDSQFIKNWSDLGVPMVVLSDWSELETITTTKNQLQNGEDLHWTLSTEAWKLHLLSEMREYLEN